LFDKVAVTAILTFSFTIIHPLSDGSRRAHRLLIHYLLEKFGVVNGWLVPVSFVILNDNLKTGAKDAVLAEVSNPIITRTRYSFEGGQITVHNETAMFFESWDATMSVEYFYSLLKKAGTGLHRLRVVPVDLGPVRTRSQQAEDPSATVQAESIYRPVS
jgi:hypothetical protein